MNFGVYPLNKAKIANLLGRAPHRCQKKSFGGVEYHPPIDQFDPSKPSRLKDTGVLSWVIFSKNVIFSQQKMVVQDKLALSHLCYNV